MNDVELMLVETAGRFGNGDAAKATLYNSKGMFALLAMLKSIADKFDFASCEKFKEVKLLHILAAKRLLYQTLGDEI